MKLSRRRLLQASASVPLLSLADSQAFAATPPNLVLLMSDQENALQKINGIVQGGNALTKLNIPARNLLYKNGISFGHGYAVALPCSPSRASIMTGLSPLQHGLFDNSGVAACQIVNDRPYLPTCFPTIASVLKQAANPYYTVYAGKWHLGRLVSDPSVCTVAITPPTLYGFDEVLAIANDNGLNSGQNDDPGYANAAAEWLLNRAPTLNRPWLLVVSLVNPHDINFLVNFLTGVVSRSKLPANFSDSLTTKPLAQTDFKNATANQGAVSDPQSTSDWLRYLDYYLALIEMNDQQTLKVLRAIQGLANTGTEAAPVWTPAGTDLSASTLVVYTSDHGEGAAAHTLRFKGPCFYEEPFNVPFVFSVLPKANGLPNANTAWLSSLNQTITNTAVTHLDLLPTLADYGSAPLPAGLSGRSLKPLLTGNAGSNPQYFYMSYDADNAQGANQGDDSVLPYEIVRVRGVRQFVSGIHLKLNRYEYYATNTATYYPTVNPDRVEYELYDLLIDPGELNNLVTIATGTPVTTYQAAFTHLCSVLDTWQQQTVLRSC